MSNKLVAVSRNTFAQDSSLDDVQYILQQVRALDPALATYINAVATCAICMNPRHEWTDQPHGDLCQRIPVVSAERYNELAESYADAQTQAKPSLDLIGEDADALLEWIEEQDPSDENAEASVARQTAFAERLRAYYLQQSET